MPKNTIRSKREKLGWTQSLLAEKTGLSLRTIQRLEAGSSIPKGYTLTQLAKVFDLDPAELQAEYEDPEGPKEDHLVLRMMNVSALAFLVFPFGNLLFPIWIWRRHKDSDLVNQRGRSIINFQVLWTFLLCLSLSIAPFAQGIFDTSVPIILITLFAFVLVLGAGIVKIGKAIDKDRELLLDLPIRLI